MSTRAIRILFMAGTVYLASAGLAAASSEDLVKKINATFLFVLSKGSEKKCWLLNLKSGKGGATLVDESTKAECTIEKQGEGFKITRMMLNVRATVPGVDPAKFQSIAQATKEGCPVSTALKGNVQIEIDAKLV